ncbi:GGDEF domain-containing protein [Hydrogenimonas sp.]
MSKKRNLSVKILTLSLAAAVAVGALFAGIRWLLQRAAPGLEPETALALESGLYAALLAPLFYLLFALRERVAGIERLEKEAHLRDDTTRLYKARVFKELAGSQIRLCKRKDWPVGLVLFDIDRLGAINEKYGYDAGDRVLKHFAATLKETVRESDLAARLDDDRFALLLPNCDAKGAQKVIRRFQERILSAPLKVERGEVKIPFSCGVVAFSGKVAKYNPLLNRAKEALESAKSRGGNRIELF